MSTIVALVRVFALRVDVHYIADPHIHRVEDMSNKAFASTCSGIRLSNPYESFRSIILFYIATE